MKGAAVHADIINMTMTLTICVVARNRRDMVSTRCSGIIVAAGRTGMNKTTTEQGHETHKRIYDFVVDYIQEHGYPPTVREIGDGAYLASTSSVHSHLLQMLESGVLETDAKNGSSRAIRVPGYKFVREG